MEAGGEAGEGAVCAVEVEEDEENREESGREEADSPGEESQSRGEESEESPGGDVNTAEEAAIHESAERSSLTSDPHGDHSGFNGFLEAPPTAEGAEPERGEEPACPSDLDELLGEIWDPHVDSSSFPDLTYAFANGDARSDGQLGAAWRSCDPGKLANGGLHFLRSEENTEDSELFTAGRIRDKLREEANDDSALSEAFSEEEDEDISALSPPSRPQTLRTSPAPPPLSLSCDATPLSPDPDRDFRNVPERRQSAPDQVPDLNGDGKLLPKRFGIADFFTRSLFSRKPKDSKAASHPASGWRLFGKTNAKENDPGRDSEECSPQEEQAEPSVGSCPQCPSSSSSSSSSGRRKNLEFEPLSTTALILEDRPANLPAKSVEETQRHKQEYEEMVAGAKRRELKDAQRKKLQMKERHRHEDSISNAMVVWNTEILPHWDSMKGSRRVRELWWQGLPPSVRGRVWSLAIGNELNITAELYEIFLSRAKEKWRSYSETSSVNDSESEGASLADRESSLDLIKLDISRTFPSLFIFQKGGPYHDLLHSVLGAYTCYRPDIGYVQGMSFIAAVLILNLEEADAFITFANLLNKPCQMAFFRVDHELMLKYFAAFEVFFEENLPRLFSHFQINNLTPDLYLIDWIFTLYSKSLPLDVACRVWDVFCRDGEESLFRTGLGILRLYEDILLQMDFIHIAQFLSRLPDDLHSHALFHAMANTHMVRGNRRWTQVFSALMKDSAKETDRNGSPALRS